MNGRSAVVVALAGLGLVAAVWSSSSAASAERTMQTERSRTAQLAQDVDRLNALRSARASAQSAEPPEDDVLRSVSESIRRAGLPTRSFSGLATSGDRAVRGRESYRKKSYRLDLQGVDVTDLGGFLDVWRSSEPLWVVEDIELRKEIAGRGRNSPDGFAVSLTIASVYAAQVSGATENRP